MLIGIVLLVGFVLVESRFLIKKRKDGVTPLVDLKLFSNRQFVIGLLISFSQSLAQSGIVFVIPLFLLLVKGYSAIQIGIAVLPITLSVMLVSILASRMSKHPKLVLASGFILTIIAAVLMSNIISIDVTGKDLAVPFAIFGAGLGLIVSQLTNVVISAFDVKAASEASGLNSTFRRLGAAFGTAVMGTILFTQFNSALVSKIKDLHLPSSIESKIVLEIENSNLSTVSFDDKSRFSGSDNKMIKSLIDESFVDATRYTLRVTAFLMLASLSLVLFLPNDIKLSK